MTRILHSSPRCSGSSVAASGRRGFTLVELIATMTIIAALGTSVAFILFTAIDGHTAGTTQADLHRRCSSAMELITRELRTIALDPDADEIAPHISEITGTRIVWEGGRRIEQQGSSLWYDAGGGPRLLVEDVESFTLTVFDDDRNPIALPATGEACHPVRRIQVELALSRHDEVAAIRSLVHVRSTLLGAMAP